MKLPKYVTKSRTTSGVLFYFRVNKGPRTRLPDDPRSEEFEEAYKACLLNKPPKPKPGKSDPRSFRWLVEHYMRTSAWSSLSDATRKQRSNIFANIMPKLGDVQYSLLTARHIRSSLEARRETPAQANNLLKALNGIFEWAVAEEHLQANPARGVDRLKAKTAGFPEWTEDDARAFCAKWEVGTMQRLAFELLLHTGLRRSDVVRLGRQHIKGRIVSITTQKTGTTITTELPDDVLDTISKTATGDTTLLVTSFGKPFAVAGFGNWFHDAAKSAGVVKNAHGVRKLAATLSANDGATAHELMAQFGWSTSKQAEVYTKGADRVQLGIRSSRRIAKKKLGRATKDEAES